MILVSIIFMITFMELALSMTESQNTQDGGALTILERLCGPELGVRQELIAGEKK